MSLLYFLYRNHNYHQLQIRYPEFSFDINLFEKIRLLLIAKEHYRGIYQNIFNKINQDLANNLDFQQHLITSGGAISLIFFSYNKDKEYLVNKIECKNIAIINQYWYGLFNKNQQEFIDKSFIKLLSNLGNIDNFWTIVIELLKKLTNKKADSHDYQPNQFNSSNFSTNHLENDSQSDKNNDLNQQSENKSPEENQQIEYQTTELQNFKPEIETTTNENLDQHLHIISSKNDDLTIKNNQKTTYRIFTNEFDEVVFPQKLIDKSKLQDLRRQLDLKMEKVKDISNKSRIKLKCKLIARQTAKYQESNEGYLNRKK